MIEGLKNFWVILSKPDNIPIAGLMVLAVFYTIHSLRRALRNDRLGNPVEASMTDRVQVWPYLVRIEFLTCIIVTLILTVWSITIDAPLEEPANPSVTPNPSKAPWYFLGLQEMLVYFDPWMAGVVMPTLIIFGLIVIPYVDTNPKGNGYYTWKERKFAIGFFIFGFLVLWVSLIQLGTFIRGPGWELYWPWEDWGAVKIVEHNNKDLPVFFSWLPGLSVGQLTARDVSGNVNPWHIIIGSGVIGAYYVGGHLFFSKWLLPKATNNLKIVSEMGPLRYWTAFIFVWTTLALPIKIILRIGFAVKYIVATPFLNI